ncbi:MAG: NADPH-dependent FMN reductase [Chitinophagaceae bacterium]
MDYSYLIISGTNRLNSNTIRVAKQYQQLLADKGNDSTLYSLEEWKWLEKTPESDAVQNQLFLPAQRFIFILPEYNGSIPGVLKLMIDLSDHQLIWQKKKALLTGISTGRAGNLRGMEHMTGILNYLNVVVHPNKLPISSIDKLLNGKGEISDAATLKAIDTQLNEFVEF